MGILTQHLQIDINQSIGIVTRLWRFTELHAPNGHIGRWPHSVIAEACKIDSAKDTWLMDGLIAAGWVDRWPEVGEVVHDWWEHCHDYVHSRLARRRQFFCNGQPPKLTRLPHGPLREELEHFYSATTPPPIPGQGELFVDPGAPLTAPTRSKTPDYARQFDEFWEVYPLKKDKARAREFWIKKLRPSEKKFKLIMQRVQQWTRFTETMLQHERFAPEYCYPSVYLRNERWEDVNELPPDLKAKLEPREVAYPTEDVIDLAREATSDGT